MKLFCLSTLSVCVLFLTGCSYDTDLRSSIFIEDVSNPGLPVYSEWGYNTFGAYCNGKVYSSAGSGTVAKVNVTDSSCVLTLTGIYDNHVNNTRVVGFELVNFKPAAYKDLVLLDDTVINLKQATCNVYIDGVKAKVYRGELNVKRVQHLFVDRQSTEAILSGYFSFQISLNNELYTYSSGRFDVGISDDNFFFTAQ